MVQVNLIKTAYEKTPGVIHTETFEIIGSPIALSLFNIT